MVYSVSYVHLIITRSWYFITFEYKTMELKEQVSVCAFMEAAQTNVEPIQKQDHLASPASKSGFISSVWFFPLVGAALVDFSSDRLWR